MAACMRFGGLCITIARCQLKHTRESNTRTRTHTIITAITIIITTPEI